ncbi:MAG TPA: undecaprenyldiphospho-muramoylpentapeptide beta-N-acetylglucosaminyltransferase [Muribaculum sp.]|jgi:UDP-N-acetylglucosamine--N-acetylmuramyl-(pentapeptide) pyrophosphoryl-undecaprenol N-acetylglucosamine transferase|uniref:UDP-N-acetylglucosamine--N-acetylmuramyl-(pentapeptide) pyrophosphoryl-undecaprenol N-acetylglucosamine transferase n=1 Tax=Heminiphilus faecis TaxID=2601703 RepID=A0ABV4CW33_9BACT|nr:undecaprenyldiphospho-muramoylpentapeptide beta-N-acetylglucosaminyltransferase [Heminiphilus faecis]RLT77055.1 undecaprenyldiphospho-muramoylpentapeptide beta-N-acetylglucosaminyltransferase [bacterium J10(2018)]HRF69358.1 undecaprenyldiphospho-muramoylpentapeptide beta-N-acetylglucosaminyltransferase [Muribaculum sp.]
MKHYRILISGGGTGGHIFPALAIANALRRRDPDTEILFVGAEGRMEMERVPAAGYDIIGLPVSGFNRKKILSNVRVLARLAKSMLRAKKVLRDFKPDMAIGVGGYASGPMLKEAQKHGIPTLLQEQNSYAGVTNKLLAKKAKAICVAYPGMERFFPQESIILTGNPVRQNILSSDMSKEEARKELGLPSHRKIVLVIGGSLGARTINESIAKAFNKIENAGGYILWQTGKLYADECRKMADKYNNVVKATPFISRMDLAYKAADVVVSRAGAGTISELQLLGKPTILIPSPNVAEDHQRKNAEALVKCDAAVMILDSDAPARLGNEVVALLNDEERCATLARNVKEMALRDADEKIVDTIYNILAEKD